MSEKETDIVIIGGGPGGATTALYLAKLGFDVTLIEKKKFPRETLCGEFLSKEVTDVLKELNIFSDFLSLNPNKLKKFVAVDESGIKLRSDLSFDAYAMKRSVFDLFLLEKAKAEKVTILQPYEATNIIKSKSHYISEITDTNGKKDNIFSKLVIAAYGKQNSLDKKLGRSFINKKSFLNGVKFHLPVGLLKEKFTDEIRIYTDDGLYCGMNQVNKSEITICFLENRKQSRIPSRQRLAEVIKSNTHFQKIFSEEALNYLTTATVYGTGNIYFNKKDVVENGIIMLGDSARVISPLAGDGIGMAMESAKLLQSILTKYDLNDRDMIYEEYTKRFEKLFVKRLKTAKFIQGMILNNNIRKLGFTVVNKFPALLPYFIKFTRSHKMA